MAITRTEVFTAVRHLSLSFFILVGVAASAHADLLTVSFSGIIDLTASGGPANSTFSGFFTWDPAASPDQIHPPDNAAYLIQSYQLILNGVDRTRGPGNAGLNVFNDSNLDDDIGDFDGVLFLARLDDNVTIGGVTGHTLFGLAFLGDKTVWDTLALPSDYAFLKLPDRFSLVSLEHSGPGDDPVVGQGEAFTATPAPVPEPATLTLSALGLAGAVARARRVRQRRDQ